MEPRCITDGKNLCTSGFLVRIPVKIKKIRSLFSGAEPVANPPAFTYGFWFFSMLKDKPGCFLRHAAPAKEEDKKGKEESGMAGLLCPVRLISFFFS